MRTFGFVTLLAGCLALLACSALAAVDQDRRQPPREREAQPPARELPQAFITSKRVVYGYGQPIDLTFSIATPKDGEVLPDFKIVRIAPVPDKDEPEVIVEPREVNGLHFWEAPGESFDGKKRAGALPAGQTYTETIADLRKWYDFDVTGPGTYRVTFGGEWITTEPKEERHALTSNTIIVRIARPPNEDEPFGEPTEGRIVPLSEVWASRMPYLEGTRQLSDLASRAGFTEADTQRLHKVYEALSKGGESTEPAFLVRGNEIDAIRHVYSVLVEGKQPEQVFRRTEQVWLVFFSRIYTPYILLDRIEHHGNLIHVTYKVVVGGPPAARAHLAIIPIELSANGMVRFEFQPVIRGLDAVIPDWPVLRPEQLLTPEIGRSLTDRISRSFDVEVME